MNRNNNIPIEDLLAQYAAEECDHDNLEWVVTTAFRYVESMEDCQVRCLLHLLAVHVHSTPSRNDVIGECVTLTQRLLNRVNRVTCSYRHSDIVNEKDMIALTSRQIEVEKELEALKSMKGDKA